MIVSMPAPTTRCSSLELGCSCFALMPTTAGSSTDLETCSCLAMARTGIEGRIVEPTKPGVRSAARLEHAESKHGEARCTQRSAAEHAEEHGDATVIASFPVTRLICRWLPAWIAGTRLVAGTR